MDYFGAIVFGILLTNIIYGLLLGYMAGKNKIEVWIKKKEKGESFEQRIL